MIIVTHEQDIADQTQRQIYPERRPRHDGRTLAGRGRLMLDGLQEILFTLRQNKLRTLLTAFGVFWGIFMLILLLGAGRGMQNGVMQDLGNEPLDIIVLFSGDTSVAYKAWVWGARSSSREADVLAVAQQISRRAHHLRATARSSASPELRQEEQQWPTCTGFPDEFFRLKERNPVYARAAHESARCRPGRARSYCSARTWSSACSTRTWTRGARTSGSRTS
jgi:hypothetical protein